MDDEDIEIMGTRTVSKRGGSYQITIPSEVIEYIGAKEGDKIVYLKNKVKKQIVIGKADKISVYFTGIQEEGFAFKL